MDFLTQVLHLVGSSAVAYVTARNMRDTQTRPNTLAGLQLAESGSVPFLEALRDRAAAEGDAWLAEKLSQHAMDERRHGQIFAHALKQLNKEVIDFKTVSQTTTEGNPNDRRRSPFFDAYFEGYSQEDLKPHNMDWLVFMGSTYILELDASKDFVRMANALPDDAISNNLRKGMLSIAKDETGHAAYLKEALERRLSTTAASAVIDEWRIRKVNAMLAMVGNFIQRSGKFPALTQDRSSTAAVETPETTLEPTAA
jgi:rubrerythrin